MPAYGEHSITLASFAQIDWEIGDHSFTEAEYAVVRRVIHTTADFEYKQLIRFGNRPFEAAMKALQQQQQIVTDVSMVAAGIGSVVAKTWRSPISIAVQKAAPLSATSAVNQDTLNQDTLVDRDTSANLADTLDREVDGGGVTALIYTRTALGMKTCANEHPEAIFAVGNAPTALLTLCEGIARGDYRPSLVIGAPVGFINVVESKQVLADLAVPYILVTGRKGGSAIAAAILNALMIWAWEHS